MFCPGFAATSAGNVSKPLLDAAGGKFNHGGSSDSLKPLSRSPSDLALVTPPPSNRYVSPMKKNLDSPLPSLPSLQPFPREGFVVEYDPQRLFCLYTVCKNAGEDKQLYALGKNGEIFNFVVPGVLCPEPQPEVWPLRVMEYVPLLEPTLPDTQDANLEAPQQQQAPAAGQETVGPEHPVQEEVATASKGELQSSSALGEGSPENPNTDRKSPERDVSTQDDATAQDAPTKDASTKNEALSKEAVPNTKGPDLPQKPKHPLTDEPALSMYEDGSYWKTLF